MFFILIQDITIDKKEYLNKFLEKANSENSELTFTNLFMWRKSYHVKFSVISDCLVIISKHKDNPAIIYFPIGDGDHIACLNEVISEFQKTGENFLIRINNNIDLEKLKISFGQKFEIMKDTNSFDYVYRVQDLSELKGKKYHAKRNFTNRFENKYNYIFEIMGPDKKGECLSLYKKWLHEKEDDIPGLDESFEAVSELLDNWESLDITGACLRVDGTMVAFSFGEPMISAKNTVVIHFEHADTSFDGAFPMMNRQFLLNCWQDFEFVNREEDMGLPGLKKAKESYYPCHMAKKYLAKLK